MCGEDRETPEAEKEEVAIGSKFKVSGFKFQVGGRRVTAAFCRL